MGGMKRITLCCDGTWNSADQEVDGKPCPTNVVRLAYRAAKRGADGTAQIVFYDQGVGSGRGLDRLSGGAFGQGLEDNIHDAYRFLIGNYEPGDAIFLFGFSRGAYTARSLAGMIRKCGILERKHVQSYREALALYRNDAHPDDAEPASFRRSRSLCAGRGIPVRFVGVWDTVGALGIPLRGLRWLTRRKHQFHDTALSSAVESACQALAIDERRAPFAPTLWTPPPADAGNAGQTIEQVWFCGSHADVGGGHAERGLSDIALGWMLERAAQAGLAFDAAVAEAHPPRPDAFAPLHDSKRGLYSLTAGIDRAIGADHSLHPSVRERWDRLPGYRPASLKRYFTLIGDPRAER